VKQEKKILVIGKTFPEPSTTAAGIRMMDLLALFLKEGYKITFASTASILNIRPTYKTWEYL
jgi:hypothetical protein